MTGRPGGRTGGGGYQCSRLIPWCERTEPRPKKPQGERLLKRRGSRGHQNNKDVLEPRSDPLISVAVPESAKGSRGLDCMLRPSWGNVKELLGSGTDRPAYLRLRETLTKAKPRPSAAEA